jgi:hypothetical protein
MAVGDIYQVVTRCSLLSKVVNNTFHWITDTVGAGTGAVELADAVEDMWTTYVSPLLWSSCILNQIYAVNYNTPADFGLVTTSVPGAKGLGGGLPATSVTAIGFRFLRIGAGARNGYKRFGGLIGADVNGNTFNGSTTDANGLATFMQSTLGSLGGSGWLWKPFIASHPIVLGSNPTGYVPTQCQFMGLSTQNSRK